MDEKFKLRSWSIGFEVPFYNPEDTTGVDTLSSNLASRYRDWFDALKVDLSIIELPSTNRLILYTIVIREDIEYTNKSTLEEDWTSMQNEVQSDLENFLKLRNLEFRVLR